MHPPGARYRRGAPTRDHAFRQHVIILEDDLEVAEDFFDYMCAEGGGR